MGFWVFEKHDDVPTISLKALYAQHHFLHCLQSKNNCTGLLLSFAEKPGDCVLESL